jgi:hypothetical protein
MLAVRFGIVMARKLTSTPSIPIRGRNAHGQSQGHRIGSTWSITGGCWPPKPIPTSGRPSPGCSPSRRLSCKRWSGMSAAAKAHFSTPASGSDGHRHASLLWRLSSHRGRGGMGTRAHARLTRQSRQAQGHDQRAQFRWVADYQEHRSQRQTLI